MNKISVYGAYGFIGDEFCRQFPDEIIRIPKHDIIPQSPVILYLISTSDNYNIFNSVTIDIETNLLMMMDVLDACYKKYGKNFSFFYSSSWFVFGNGSETPFTEESLCTPVGFYSLTKYFAEQLLQSYCTTFGIKYRILRLSNVLGGRDKKVSKKKNTLQFVINKLVHNEDVELYSGGKFCRDYIDVRDAVRAIKLAMTSGTFPIYNISNGTSHVFKDLVDLAVKYSGSKSNLWDKPSQVQNVYLSNEKLKSLGYSPQYTIEDTIKSIVDFYEGRNG